VEEISGLEISRNKQPMLSAFQRFKDNVILLAWEWFTVIIVTQIYFIGYSVRESFTSASLNKIMNAFETDGLYIDHDHRYCMSDDVLDHLKVNEKTV
jgi:hypothetical protein